MQFKVPQDVQQADRIVAFLTLPQLIICVVGFGIAYGVYTVLVRQGLVWVFWGPPVFIILALTAAFAFLRVANLPFHNYLALVIERFVTPSKRMWVKGSDRVITSEESLVTNEEKKAQEKIKAATAFHVEKEEKLQKIGEITDILDTLKKEPEVEPAEDIDTITDDDLLHKAFLDEAPHGVSTTPKKVETAEEMIMSMSSVPSIEMAPAPKPATPPITVTPIPAPVQTPATVQIPKQNPVPVPVPVVSTNPVSPDAPAKRKRRRRRKKKLQTNTPAPAVTAPEAAKTQEKSPKAPPLPEWLKEEPKAKKEEAPKVEVKQQDVVSERNSSVSVGMEKMIESTLEVPETEPLLAAPETEPILAAPEPEPVLSAPEVEPMLAAPEQEPLLEPPETHELLPTPANPVPNNEITTVTPAQEPTPPPPTTADRRNDITPQPPSQPSPTAKISETLSAEDLKKGKTITFP